jgi:hypothetical protein
MPFRKRRLCWRAEVFGDSYGDGRVSTGRSLLSSIEIMMAVEDLLIRLEKRCLKVCLPLVCLRSDAEGLKLRLEHVGYVLAAVIRPNSLA